jgi:hypothetical protein
LVKLVEKLEKKQGSGLCETPLEKAVIAGGDKGEKHSWALGVNLG